MGHSPATLFNCPTQAKGRLEWATVLEWAAHGTHRYLQLNETWTGCSSYLSLRTILPIAEVFDNAHTDEEPFPFWPPSCLSSACPQHSRLHPDTIDSAQCLVWQS